MTDKEIQKLVDRYLDGSTSAEEERQLARELQRADIPKDWQAIRMMLGELTMGEAAYDDIMAQRRAKVVRMRRRWIAAAASLLLIVGIGAVMMKKPTQDTPVAAVETMKPSPLDNRGYAQRAPEAARKSESTLEEWPSSTTGNSPKAVTPSHSRSRPTLHASSREDTLGNGIWQSERNVMLGMQLLAECETIIEKREQEIRNDIVKCTYNATPQTKSQLVVNDNGDYIIVEDNRQTIIEI